MFIFPINLNLNIFSISHFTKKNISAVDKAEINFVHAALQLRGLKASQTNRLFRQARFKWPSHFLNYFSICLFIYLGANIAENIYKLLFLKWHRSIWHLSTVAHWYAIYFILGSMVGPRFKSQQGRIFIYKFGLRINSGWALYSIIIHPLLVYLVQKVELLTAICHQISR